MRALPGPLSLAGVAFVHKEGAANGCRPRSLDLPHVFKDLKPKTPVTHDVWELLQGHVVLLQCRKAVPDVAVAPSQVVQPISHLGYSPLPPWSGDQDEAHQGPMRHTIRLACATDRIGIPSDSRCHGEGIQSAGFHRRGTQTGMSAVPSCLK